MAAPEELYIQVERLLAGSYSAQGLDRIFLYLRERPFGRWAVKEVGDFVGHWAGRNVGKAHDYAKHFVAAARFHLDLTGSNVGDLAGLIAALRGTARQENPAGPNGKLERAIVKIEGFDSATRTIIGSTLTSGDWKVVDYFANRLISRPMFAPQQVVKEMGELLCKQGIIDESDLPALERATDYISVYVVSKMHKADIDLGNGVMATFRATLKVHEGKIGVLAQGPLSDSKPMFIRMPAFVTGCAPAQWCHPDLIAIPASEEIPPLELIDGLLTPMKRLRRSAPAPSS